MNPFRLQRLTRLNFMIQMLNPLKIINQIYGQNIQFQLCDFLELKLKKAHDQNPNDHQIEHRYISIVVSKSDINFHQQDSQRQNQTWEVQNKKIFEIYSAISSKTNQAQITIISKLASCFSKMLFSIKKIPNLQFFSISSQQFCSYIQIVEARTHGQKAVDNTYMQIKSIRKVIVLLKNQIFMKLTLKIINSDQNKIISQFTMLERVESKKALILLFVVSLLAFASNITALVISVIWNYIGSMMNSTSSTYICSAYLTLKLQTNIAYNFNAIFFSGCTSALIQLITLAHLAYLTIKFANSNDKYFQELSQSMFARLYIGYSLGLLGLCISVGFYGCYIVEYGWRCLNLFFRDWLVLGSLFLFGLLCLLVCWIYLLVFWITNMNKFEQVKEQPVVQESEIDQPVNMIGLFQTIKQALKKQTIIQQKRQINQSLIQESLQDSDHYSVINAVRQRLQILTFEQYKKKEYQKQQKELFQEQIMMKLLIHEENRRKGQKQKKAQAKAKEQAQKGKSVKPKMNQVSFDDSDFDNQLLDSQKKEPVKNQPALQNHQIIKFEEYFPHNFLPKNQQERNKFQRYKQKLLTKYKMSQIANNNLSLAVFLGDKSLLNRHPQNIQGGRSKRQMSKYYKKNKKPVRDESIYLKKQPDKIQEEAVEKPREQSIKEDFSQKAREFKPILSQNLFGQPIQTIHIPKEQNIRRPYQQQPQKLYFHKTKTKSQCRKKLFEEEQTFLSRNQYKSILGVLVKGTQQANMKQKLKQLRQNRQLGAVGMKKRTQRLIDSIRSKYN